MNNTIIYLIFRQIFLFKAKLFMKNKQSATISNTSDCVHFVLAIFYTIVYWKKNKTNNNTNNK